MATQKVPTLGTDGRVRDKHLPDRLTAASLAAGLSPKADKAILPPARPARGARLPVTMTSGAAFTQNGTTNTTDIAVSDLNYQVITDGLGGFANWHRWNGITALNMVGKGFLFFLKATNAANLRYVSVSAGSDSGPSNYFQHNIPIPADGKSVLREGEWVPVWIPWTNFNIRTKTGTPDAAAIVSIKIIPTDFGAAGVPAGTAKLEIGKTFGVYTDPAVSGAIMWSFDDSYTAALDGAVKLAGVGHRGVLHPIVERLDTAGFLTTAQVLKLQNLYGWEIGVHCMTNAQHVSMVGQTDAQMDQMLTDLRAWQRSIGAESNAFAYPIGPFDKNAVNAVAKHYGYARTNDELATPSRLPQPLQASATALSGTANTLTSVKALLDQVAANKSMINVIVHKLMPGATSVQNEWALADFNSLVDYAVSIGLKNTTTAQMLALT
jgi:hypothetical protein